MSDIQKRITAILQERHNELPEINRQIGRWEKLKKDLVDLSQAIGALREHEDSDGQALDVLGALPFDAVNSNISQAVANLEHLGGRFNRPTLNIGVSGSARVGKSTLLQSISGLQDEQIPVGSGLPVTAVRSRIFHADRSRAILRLHDYASFRQDVLQPYHDVLGLPEAPHTIEQFASYQYPDSVADLPEGKRQESTSITRLNKLKDMQASLPSYRDELTGKEKEVGFDGLRRYVAYPTADVEEQGRHSGQVVPRPYLAVRDVKIDCPFPFARVNQLGIIDLPGLGELNASAEERHLEGLQNDVDLVLLVKRPLEGKGYWGSEDGKAANLLDRVRGFVENRRDFVYIVINTGGVTEGQISSLRGDILRNVNDGVPGKNFQVLETDTANEKDVYEHLLEPVLTHLAERLPVMDRQIRDKTIAQSADIIAQVREILSAVEAGFAKGKASHLGSSEQETLIEKADELNQTLATVLKGDIEALWKKNPTGYGSRNPGF